MNHLTVDRRLQLSGTQRLPRKVDIDPVAEWNVCIHRRPGFLWRRHRSCHATTTLPPFEPRVGRPTHGSPGCVRCHHVRRRPHHRIGIFFRGHADDTPAVGASRVVFCSRIPDIEFVDTRDGGVVRTRGRLVDLRHRVTEEPIDPQFFLGQQYLRGGGFLVPVEGFIDLLLVFRVPRRGIGRHLRHYSRRPHARPHARTHHLRTKRLLAGRRLPCLVDVSHGLFHTQACGQRPNEHACVVLVALEQPRRQFAVRFQRLHRLHEIGPQRFRPDAKRPLAVPELPPLGKRFPLDPHGARVDVVGPRGVGVLRDAAHGLQRREVSLDLLSHRLDLRGQLPSGEENQWQQQDRHHECQEPEVVLDEHRHQGTRRVRSGNLGHGIDACKRW